MLFASWQVRIVKKTLCKATVYLLFGPTPKPANNLFIFSLTLSNQCFVQERLRKQKDKNLPVFTLRSK